MLTQLFSDPAGWGIVCFFAILLAIFSWCRRVELLPDGHFQSFSPKVISGDEPHYLLILNSILFDHDLELQDDYERAKHDLDAGGVPLPDHHTIIVNKRTGEHGYWYSERDRKGLQPGPDVYEVPAHPPAFPALIALFLAPFDPALADVQFDASNVVVLICWLGAVFTYLLARRVGMNRGLALFATALLALASPWLPYTRSFFAEPVIGLSVVVALWALEANRPVTSALAAAAAAAFKPSFAIIGAGFVIDRVEQKRWRDLLVITAILVVGALGLFAFNYWLARTPIIAGNFGAPWPMGGNTAKNFVQLEDTFISTDHGLFVWAPWTIFAVFPIGHAFCSRSAQPGFLRTMSFPMGLQVATLALMAFGPGYCFGPRYWVPFLPWMSVAAVETVRSCGWVWRTIFAILALTSMAFAVVGALRYPDMMSLSPLHLWTN